VVAKWQSSKILLFPCLGPLAWVLAKRANLVHQACVGSLDEVVEVQLWWQGYRLDSSSSGFGILDEGKFAG
jgi:hypothetical protein